MHSSEKASLIEDFRLGIGIETCRCRQRGTRHSWSFIRQGRRGDSRGAHGFFYSFHIELTGDRRIFTRAA